MAGVGDFWFGGGAAASRPVGQPKQPLHAGHSIHAPVTSGGPPSQAPPTGSIGTPKYTAFSPAQRPLSGGIGSTQVCPAPQH